ncbi:MAG: alanyl-tRNA editing protein [Oscillibacter sp.]|nr:alanyl-tRNA editing protein [Oscillibacter sp.]
METVKLYYNDSFLREFDAAVTDCQPCKSGFAVVLDQTAFYPEGGGQPADHGTLGGAAVSDVREKDGVITHICDTPLTPGETVHGTLDWERRFDHMQQHSGEHIVSGMLCETFHCDNVGFHMGTDTVTIDYNAEMTWEDVLAIEARANRYIWEDQPFRAFYPSPEELAVLPYRSKKELTGDVRITNFPGADLCACCGTHVKSSAQVGLVKFLSCQKFREGVRLEVLCGQRALAFLAGCWEQNHQIGQELSVKPFATYGAVCRLKEELAQVKERGAHLEETVFAGIAEQCRGRGNVLRLESEALSSDAVRRLSVAIGAVCGGRSAVFAGSGSSYKYALVEEGGDLRNFVKEMNGALCGRGGGKDGFAQGSVQASDEEISRFFAHK